MTEFHAGNVRNNIASLARSFDAAATAGDIPAIREAWRKLLYYADTAIQEARGARIEAESLATELESYRPRRSQEPPAPRLDDYTWVHTAKFPWVCAAKVRRETIRVAADLRGGGIDQEHWIPERKTACGKATTFEVRDRFGSGGWPRLHEICPDCVRWFLARGTPGFAAGEVGEERTIEVPASGHSEG